MAIKLLQITAFRNLTQVDFQPIPSGLNVITGLNGSGKTSILEAIYYISHHRSFRSASTAKLIQHQQPKFSLFAHLTQAEALSLAVGMERHTHGETRMRVGEKEATSITEVAQYLPIRLIHSQSYNLFEAGPLFRRKYLDWGLFYQENQFLNTWRHVERALRQRNIVLKEKRTQTELEAWNHEFIRYGLELDALRQRYVERITG